MELENVDSVFKTEGNRLIREYDSEKVWIEPWEIRQFTCASYFSNHNGRKGLGLVTNRR